MFVIEAQETVHKRDVYNFLFVLADLGGVQLIVTLIISYITNLANDRKSMLSIVKKFFFVVTKDPNALPKKKNWGENVYEFSLKKEHKASWCLYFFACCGMTPSCNK